MKLTNCRYIDIISIIQTGQGWFNLYMMMVKTLLQSAMLETSIECDNLNKKNMDLHQEMKLIEDKLKTMSLKYDNLEVKFCTSTSSDNYVTPQGTFAKKIEEKRFECENFFFKEMEEDKMRWKQSSDQIIYDLMQATHIGDCVHISK